MKFSIIVPVYNGEKVIIRALTSALEQTFQDHEVIVVNDGSTDNTQQVVESYINNQNHKISIKLINTENNGRSSARNLGVTKSNSDFVCFLDADDEFHKEHLFEFSKAIERYNHINCFFGDSVIVRDDSSWASYDNYLPRFLDRGEFWTENDGCIQFGQSFSEFLIEGSLIPMCSAAIRRATFIEAGGFNERFSVSEDFELWFRLALNHNYIAVNKVLSTVYHHSDNTSHPQNKYLTLQKQIDVTDYILHKYEDLNSNHIILLVKKRNTLITELLYHSSNITPFQVLISYKKNRGYKAKVTSLACSLLIKSILKYFIKYTK
ncbi:glycosyltransferase family 2 protein [Colwellia sp. BRX8-9]|uniref:glycosyltransferase family 2 protein n=1 Tax=Colwellia sp. BRX8-9 TaxID=2759831 RepID=UPI0015F6561F|nr:glycosyltransferase family 2 protein [Colwellia sp. BRX8-9]MBA6348688.1 glycosyltransferase family 2 protein [Colwellia sp. BRX8-9]